MLITSLCICSQYTFPDWIFGFGDEHGAWPWWIGRRWLRWGRGVTGSIRRADLVGLPHRGLWKTNSFIGFTGFCAPADAFRESIEKAGLPRHTCLFLETTGVSLQPGCFVPHQAPNTGMARFLRTAGKTYKQRSTRHRSTEKKNSWRFW